MKLNDTVLTIHPSQKVNLPNNPSVKEAVEYMKTSMDMLDWNLKRSRVRRAVGTQNFIDNYVSEIDCKGLCSKTLLKSKKINQNHIPFTKENVLR